MRPSGEPCPRFPPSEPPAPSQIPFMRGPQDQPNERIPWRPVPPSGCHGFPDGAQNDRGPGGGRQAEDTQHSSFFADDPFFSFTGCRSGGTVDGPPGRYVRPGEALAATANIQFDFIGKGGCCEVGKGGDERFRNDPHPAFENIDRQPFSQAGYPGHRNEHGIGHPPMHDPRRNMQNFDYEDVGPRGMMQQQAREHQGAPPMYNPNMQGACPPDWQRPQPCGFPQPQQPQQRQQFQQESQQSLFQQQQQLFQQQQQQQFLQQQQRQQHQQQMFQQQQQQFQQQMFQNQRQQQMPAPQQQQQQYPPQDFWQRGPDMRANAFDEQQQQQPRRNQQHFEQPFADDARRHDLRRRQGQDGFDDRQQQRRMFLGQGAPPEDVPPPFQGQNRRRQQHDRHNNFVELPTRQGRADRFERGNQQGSQQKGKQPWRPQQRQESQEQRGYVPRSWRQQGEITLAQRLRAAKASLKRVDRNDAIACIKGDKSDTPGSKSVQMPLGWTLHGLTRHLNTYNDSNVETHSTVEEVSEDVAEKVVAAETEHSKRHDKAYRYSKYQQNLREVVISMEGRTPAHGEVSVSLNGEVSKLQQSAFPMFSRRASNNKDSLLLERRFPIVPLQSYFSKSGSSPSEGRACKSDEKCQKDTARQEIRELGAGFLWSSSDHADAKAQGDDECSTSDTAQASDGNLDPGPSRVSMQDAGCDKGSRTEDAAPDDVAPQEASEAQASAASFAVSVLVDSCEVSAKTKQTLLEPEVVVAQVNETSVTLRILNLTGDKFEVIVYAVDAQSKATASSFVHRGVVMSPELTHRFDKLQSAQVYVAWVKVTCENKTMESKQKGFKTNAEREKTIWDESDYVILGVSRDATAKEITRAWRQKSLQHHPDKVLDEEQKVAAEDMMKRLNLAKQNLLRAAAPDSTDAADEATPQTTTSCQAYTDYRSSHFCNQYDYDDSNCGDFGGLSDVEDQGPSTSSARRPSGSGACGADGEDSEEEGPADSLRCSLRLQVSKSPRLEVVKRFFKALMVQATGLTVGSVVEVQYYDAGSYSWSPAAPKAKADASTMRFMLEDLEENKSYRLRLHLVMEMEPLHLLFAAFAPPGSEC
eukprot:TRINITY_DN5398_c0_g2_i2.p1 TRINITY_DN5398_c0_g2~~TRINITY_DN5398_c0_g2_i2.p1  ORF type:complete len:1093 (-),score=196.50 TRINITY_DN5398_c0_g2_i2:374-3652(-)